MPTFPSKPRRCRTHRPPRTGRRRPPSTVSSKRLRKWTGRPAGGSGRDGRSARHSRRWCDRYLFPALQALGDAWQAGNGFGGGRARGERRRRAVDRRRVRRGRNEPRRTRGPILVGLPAAARHELAALAFATAARRAGLTVQYIGADVPAAEWVRAARATNASAAVIGVPTATDAPPARAVVASLRRALPDLLVTLGGDGARGMRRQSILLQDAAGCRPRTTGSSGGPSILSLTGWLPAELAGEPSNEDERDQQERDSEVSQKRVSERLQSQIEVVDP